MEALSGHPSLTLARPLSAPNVPPLRVTWLSLRPCLLFRPSLEVFPSGIPEAVRLPLPSLFVTSREPASCLPSEERASQTSRIWAVPLALGTVGLRLPAMAQAPSGSPQP